MLYKEFQGKKLSALGFGTMRLPVRNGVYADIDQAEVDRMFEYAISHGVNYFDTAWGYHEGQSELAVGRALKKYPRESFYLADKFPGYDLNNMGKVEEIFEKQLEKCQVDYFDFYLFHNVCEMNINAYLDDAQYGTFSYLMKQKENGRIKHLGFSGHGELSVLMRFLEKYGHAMEFGQLQVNYLDWRFQRAKEKVELLKRRNIPLWVMEPVRGGKLAKLPEDAETKLRELRPDESIPAWAFRFLQSMNETVVTLSGMSNFEQVMDNVTTYTHVRLLNNEERETLLDIAFDMVQKATLACTSCRYCTGHCPKHLNIPEIIRLYNEHRFTGDGFIAPMTLSSWPEETWPSACVGCGSCVKVCPQQIRIPDMMRDFMERLR